MTDDRTPPDDPVLRRREQVRRLTQLGQQAGYLLFGLAIVAFFVAFVTEFTDTVVTFIVACLVIGSLVLAPAIVFSYAVKAADKDDRAS